MAVFCLTYLDFALPNANVPLKFPNDPSEELSTLISFTCIARTTVHQRVGVIG